MTELGHELMTRMCIRDSVITMGLCKACPSTLKSLPSWDSELDSVAPPDGETNFSHSADIQLDDLSTGTSAGRERKHTPIHLAYCSQSQSASAILFVVLQ